MEIYVNNQKSEFVFDDNVTIGDAVKDISKKLKSKHQVICQLSVDDVIVPEAQEHEIFGYEIGAAKNINLMIDSVDNLVENGLKSLEGLIPELVNALAQTADLHRTGQDAKAKKVYSASLEALEIVPTVLGDVRSAKQLDFSKIEIKEKLLSELEQDMLSILGSIFDAQKKEDFVTLSDVIEYELIPNLIYWRDAVPAIIELCKERVNS